MQRRAIMAIRFADAGDHYRTALSLLDRVEQPELSAATLHNLAEHEVLFDFESAHRPARAWLERYPDDLDAPCNLAETQLTAR